MRDQQTAKTTYWPLIALLATSLLVSVAITTHLQVGLMASMHYFMGFFLCVFALLKLFNVSKFAKAFRMYDLLAKAIKPYAFIYPFIELVIGLSLLAFMVPHLTYIVLIVVMSINAISVVIALANGLNINCPCMGSILEVPLSTVTLTEDLVMVAMAIIMLI